jgi:transmembrane sensor
MTENELLQSLRSWYRNELSSVNEPELMQFLAEPNNKDVVMQVMDQLWMQNEAFTADNKVHIEKVLQSIIQEPKSPVIIAHRIHFLKTAWFRYAAVFILIFGIVAYLWSHNKPTKTTTSEKIVAQQEILPGSNKAILTLSDGLQVELNNKTTNINEAGINIINTAGKLKYGKADRVVMNTMSTPNGGQYQLTLPDGSRVWLNAASSITYPTAFTNNTREVQITGEAYFEIAQNKSQPFIVKTTLAQITVLGTSFNVNNYPDEPGGKISIASGAVKINNQLLAPGQAFINGKIISTDINQDIAWKNGYFNMQGVDIKTVMRSIARWYDVDVLYQKNITHKFYIKFARITPLSDVIKILEATGRVHLSLKGKTLIIQ